jgi:hypothetical protein
MPLLNSIQLLNMTPSAECSGEIQVGVYATSHLVPLTRIYTYLPLMA